MKFPGPMTTHIGLYFFMQVWSLLAMCGLQHARFKQKAASASYAPATVLRPYRSFPSLEICASNEALTDVYRWNSSLVLTSTSTAAFTPNKLRGARTARWMGFSWLSG